MDPIETKTGPDGLSNPGYNPPGMYGRAPVPALDLSPQAPAWGLPGPPFLPRPV